MVSVNLRELQKTKKEKLYHILFAFLCYHYFFTQCLEIITI